MSGISIRDTTTKTHYFIEVDAKIYAKLKPFMELKEVGGRHPPEGVTTKGWYITADKLNFIQPFLTATAAISWNSPAVSAIPNKTTVHWLSNYEMVLLALLLNQDKAWFRNFYDIPVWVPYFNHRDRIARDRKVPYGVQQSPELQDLVYRYLRNRDVWTYGDLLRYDFYPPRELHPSGFPPSMPLYIYDGVEFISIPPFPNQTLPDKFTCPKPFPIMYFVRENGLNTTVHPDFSLPDLQLEYEKDPPIPPCKLDGNYSAIRMTLKEAVDTLPLPDEFCPRRVNMQDKVYRVYYYIDRHIPAPSYERVTKIIMEGPAKQFYQACDDTTVTMFVHPTDEENAIIDAAVEAKEAAELAALENSDVDE